MLTVIIATHNGAKTLPWVLDGYKKLTAPAGGWKLVIADNCSTDATPKIIQQYSPCLPISTVQEDRRGQNWARLAALTQIEGDFIVFSDDDARPDPNWLIRLQAVAAQQPDYDIFGGTIVPEWEIQPPAWVFEWVDFGACFTLTDPFLREGPVAPNLVWSPNMAYRRKIFEAGYVFDTAVGPSGTSYAMGSETDFNVRLGEAGFRSWFTPNAVVHHFIRGSQLDPKWIYARAIRFGRGMYRRQLLRQDSVPPLVMGIPRYLYRMIAEQAVRYGMAALRRDSKRFLQRWELNYLLGCAIQSREFYTSSGR